MDFSSLGLNQAILTAVAEQGYDQPTPIQAQAIPAILAQQDIMAGAQTGTGKTAAFALPILQLLTSQKISQPTSREPSDVTSASKSVIRALILTPTRELTQQVYRSFESYAKHSPIKVALAYGGVSINPQIAALAAGADILVATPGRLLDLVHKGEAVLDQVQTLVFDEADRMLDMGFIDDIKRIIKQVPVNRQTLLFSATFDPAVIKLSQSLLTDAKLIEVDQRNTAADQIEQVIYSVDADRKRELTSYLIGSKNWQQVLIFTRTKQGADALAKEMCKDGIKTQSIHGDKSQGAREKALEEFKLGKTRALVATDVASRGLDIELLKVVINYELPYIAEDYIHRIGRTGRAGSAGLAISLLSPDEEWLLDAIEAVLDTRLPQQWLPGYEPDLTKVAKPSRKNSRTAPKQRAKQRSSSARHTRRKP
jgi:ATP-dependent RNA helicase RhlE